MWQASAKTHRREISAHVRAVRDSCRPRFARRIWPAICTCCRFPAASSSGDRRSTTSWPQQLPWPSRFRCCTRSCGAKRRADFACRSRAGCTSRAASLPSTSDLHRPIRNTFQRTHRWSRVHRYEDELAMHGRGRSRGPCAVQHAGRRLGSVRQADGAQRPGLDARFSTAARRPAGPCARSDRQPRSAWPTAGCSAIGFIIRRCASAGTRCIGTGRWWPIFRARRGCRRCWTTRRSAILTAYRFDKPDLGPADRALAAAARSRAAAAGGRGVPSRPRCPLPPHVDQLAQDFRHPRPAGVESAWSRRLPAAC